MRYVSVGDVPRKRHTLFREPGGSRLAEELMGEQGFTGASSLLYHRHSPSALSGVEAVGHEPPAMQANQPLAPWHLRVSKLGGGGDAVTGRTPLLASDTLTISYFAAEADSDLFRDSRGDELYFVQSGRGVLETVFGTLDIAPGDYAVVPASTTHRWTVDRRDGPMQGLVLEAKGHIDLPARYLTQRGQLREGAPYSERDFRVPVGPLVVEGDEVDVLVAGRSGYSRHRHISHPFDVLGWDGCLYPFAFSVHDFEPVVGRVHQPPPVHQTFEGPGFVVCSFVPRPYDFGEGAVKVPYHHANVDSDEVLYYVSGDFMSRAGAGIEVGSLTLHPAGFVHGPQPGSVEASMAAQHTDEIAVMVDTFGPLSLSEAARSVADPMYVLSWAGRARG
ncbi:MAG TPA: homogentisate 1,2-dioxygenase [Acidimicrobiales bacterium]|nr:homogentisate 1,2-dioxygenase [Acidimicrobiales bacterium]